ncbi:hypothetical protein [Eisenibacter elegans]|jgi:hypothetical protein|uniref:hypothetical protein n=1 Tax=Eisenibacter elegans TaxID=997 RepID=UPI00040AFCDA|nr:hypothetical protein [Eisenibacter elegans]
MLPSPSPYFSWDIEQIRQRSQSTPLKTQPQNKRASRRRASRVAVTVKTDS